MRKFYLFFALLLGVSSMARAGVFTPDPNKVYIIKNVNNSYIPMFCVTQLKFSNDGEQKYVLGARNNKFDSRSFFVINGNSTDGYTICLKEVTEENNSTITTNRYVSLKTGATNNQDHTIRTKIVSNVNNLTNNEKWNITETAEGSGKYIISSKALTTTNSWNIRGGDYSERNCTDQVKGVGTWNDNTKTTNQWYIYSIDDLQQEIISKYGNVAEEYKGKVGYPVDEYIDNLNTLNTNYTSLCSAWSVSVANNFGNAYNYLSSTTTIPINMPVNGKAYRFKNKAYGVDKYWYFKYNESGVTTTEAEAEATTFVCREIRSGVYTFVCNDGKYLAWKGRNTDDDKRGANENKGYVDAYDHQENGTVPSGNTTATQSLSDWAQLTVEKLAGSNVSGGLADLWGYVTIKGRRASQTSLNYFVLKADGSYDHTSAPYFKNSNGTNFSSAFILEEVPYANVVTMKSFEGTNNIATFSAPFPTVVPANTTAYSVATQTDGNITSVNTYTVATAGEAIPANTGVILLGSNTSLTMLPRTTEEIVTIEDGALKHSAGAAKDITSENSYVLANKTTGWGFYKVGASASALPMNKAYLVLPTNTPQSFVRCFFGNTTGLDSTTLQNASTNNIYDLSGRQVKVASKGVYIINGKKVLVK